MCTSNRDHETNGRLHRHISAFCITMGKQLQHAEKDCIHKKNGSKTSKGLSVTRCGQCNKNQVKMLQQNVSNSKLKKMSECGNQCRNGGTQSVQSESYGTVSGQANENFYRTRVIYNSKVRP